MKKHLKGIITGLVLAAFALTMAPSAAQAATTLATPTKIIRSGVTATATTVGSTTDFKVYLLTDGVILQLTNPGASAFTFTATDQLISTITGVATNATVAVAGGTTVTLGPWKKSRWADGQGYLNWAASGMSTTTVAAYRLPLGEPDSQTK